MATKERLGGVAGVAARPVAGGSLAAVASAGLGLLALAGCESEDPCARRQAACIDLTLIGRRDDGNGGAIAYRGLSVSIYAPNLTGPSRNQPDKCEAEHVYGSELGPVGTLLASQEVPELKLLEPYAAAVQAKLLFQLSDSFNQVPDMPPSDVIDPLPNEDAKIAALKTLRDEDPRAVRILVLQSGQEKSVWDSRCDENLYSKDEWLMKKHYRVGANEAISRLAVLEGAKTSAP